jgi:hypothetical protein
MPVTKRYQVFVSSTFLDLKDQRQVVLQELLKLDCIPAGMELFPASSDQPLKHIQKVIDDTDYYILIVGERYGSTPPSGTTSYTELEFDYARSKGVPVIALLQATVSAEAGDNPRALEAFREKIKRQLQVASWANDHDLRREAFRGLQNVMQERARVGWVRGDAIDTSGRPLPVPAAALDTTVELNVVRVPQRGPGGPLRTPPIVVTVSAMWRQIFRAFAGHLTQWKQEDDVLKLILAKIVPFDPRMQSGSDAFTTDSMFILRAHFQALDLVEVTHGAGSTFLWWRLTDSGHQQFLREYTVPPAS